MGSISDADSFFARAAKVDEAWRLLKKSTDTTGGPSGGEGGGGAEGADPYDRPCSRVMLNSALLAFSRNDFVQAMGLLEEVIKRERKRQTESQLTFEAVSPTQFFDAPSAGSTSGAGAGAGAGTDLDTLTAAASLVCGIDVEDDLISVRLPSLPPLSPPVSLPEHSDAHLDPTFT